MSYFFDHFVFFNLLIIFKLIFNKNIIYLKNKLDFTHTAVLENDLIAQSFLPAIGSRPKTTKNTITKLLFLAKITNTEYFGE